MSLIEVILALCLTAILSVSSIVHFKDAREHAVTQRFVDDLLSVMSFAHNYAFTHDVSLSLCLGHHDLFLWRYNQSRLLYQLRIPEDLQVSLRSSFHHRSCVQWQENGFSEGQQGSIYITQVGELQNNQRIILSVNGVARVGAFT